MTADREKMFNLPGVVTALLAVLFVIQLMVELAPEAWEAAIVDAFAFIPIRLSYLFAPNVVIGELTNGAAVDARAQAHLALILNQGASVVLTPLTYAFLHGNWTHLAINSLTLAAFGSPVARRFGTTRFLAFLAVCAIAGALAHFVLHPFELVPVVGASAAISGTMGAIVRFAFTPEEPASDDEIDEMPPQPREGTIAPLSRLSSNRQAMFFLVTWLMLNVFFGMFPQAAGSSSAIAWEAHIGGLLAGLLLFDAFDRGEARRAPGLADEA